MGLLKTEETGASAITTQRSVQPTRSQPSRSISGRAKQGIQTKADKANCAEEKPKRPLREPKPLPDRSKILRMIAEMHAELTGDTRKEAWELRRSLALPAMNRLGLVITGRQEATVPQVVTAVFAVLEADGSDKHDISTAAETTAAE